MSLIGWQCDRSIMCVVEIVIETDNDAVVVVVVYLGLTSLLVVVSISSLA